MNQFNIYRPEYRSLSHFLGLVFSLGAVFYALFLNRIFSIDLGFFVMPLGYMFIWVPSFCALICTFFGYENFSVLGFKKFHWIFGVLGFGLPMGIALVDCFILWGSGISSVEIHPMILEYYNNNMTQALSWIIVVAPIIGHMGGIGFGIFINFLIVLGEEIGWRGLLSYELRFLPAVQRYILTGVLWTLWHIPLIILGILPLQDANLGIFSFTVMTLSMSIVLGWLRDHSRSLIPVVLFHASHIVWIQEILPLVMKKTPLASLWGGEIGLIVPTLYLVLALLVLWSIKYAPLVTSYRVSVAEYPVRL